MKFDRHFYFDLETECFSSGNMAPDVVCMQFCWDTDKPQIVHAGENRAGVFDRVRDVLRDPHVQIVGQNIAYDFACLAADDETLLPLIFAAYEANRVTDTEKRQKLADISRGRFRTRQYDLGSLADIHKYPHEIDKLDTWRTRYHELREVALKYWPAAAVEYALRDPDATRWVHKSQEMRYDPAWYCDEFNQVRKFWCLQLMATWGIRTDQRGVDDLARGAREEIEACRELLEQYELVRPDGTRNVKKARERVVEAYRRIGKDYPRPKQVKGRPASNNPATDNDACMQADDFVLEEYATFSQMSKVLSADVVMLTRGLEFPIHTHFDIVESGRTSSASPNIQNPRRLTGVRECFVPRDGNIFIDADESALELRTVAQVCKRIVGYSKLAEVLNRGHDPHTALAAQMMGKSYEWTVANKADPEVDNWRTAAKGMNFGFPGGLGAASFPAFAWRAYKVRVTQDQVAQWKEGWLASFPEFRDYHRFIGETYEHAGVRHLFTNRLRARVTFTSAANSYFQGLGADVCGGALWNVSRACYTDRRSVLFGSRPVNFMHDSILTETDRRIAHEALAEQERLMLEGSAPYLPDVPPAVDGKAMTRWSKDAMRITHNGQKTSKGGRVVPWSPTALGESLDDYARRCDLSLDAVRETYGVQQKALAKAEAKRAAKRERRAA